ncbi:MAG: tRNA-binding protein [Flavobacteriales bacterium]|nr:tRNA-binding protein [Flavobacteriales bacterium]MDG1780807.1 tRNA-binding protein [Flavobacteriales bacterium]MDG2245688.1 tRNA-binding protein [Flavobacteriales bacterium]
MLEFSDFQKVDMRIGTILEVRDFPEARNPSYQLWVDFGKDLGVKKTSAQLTKRYSKEDLAGKQVVAVVNFPPKQIAHFMSECLILGAVGEDGDVILLAPEAAVSNGLRIG